MHQNCFNKSEILKAFSQHLGSLWLFRANPLTRAALQVMKTNCSTRACAEESVDGTELTWEEPLWNPWGFTQRWFISLFNTAHGKDTLINIIKPSGVFSSFIRAKTLAWMQPQRMVTQTEQRLSPVSTHTFVNVNCLSKTSGILVNSGKMTCKKNLQALLKFKQV